MNDERIIEVNFPEEEEYVSVPAGTYIVKVKEVTLRESGEGKQYLNWILKIAKPEEYKDRTLYFVTSLQPQALFNLRRTLIALGKEVPKKAAKVKLNLDKLIGGKMKVKVAIENYEGMERPRIVGVYSLDKEEQVEIEEEEIGEEIDEPGEETEKNEDVVEL